MNATTPAATATPTAPTALTSPQNKLTKSQRVAMALQTSPGTVNRPLPVDLDTLCPYLPGATPQPDATHDRREWLTAPSIAVSPVAGSQSVKVSMSPPPAPLTGAEKVLYPEIGLACARAAFFLYEWLKTRRYMASCDVVGVGTHEISQYRLASPTFSAAFDAVEAVVRTSKLVRTEDTIHALANGDVRKVKTVTDQDGATTTTDEGSIYDTRAAQLELAALDPARYGGKGAGAGGVAVSIVLQCPPCDVRPAVDVVATSAQVPEDVDYVDA